MTKDEILKKHEDLNEYHFHQVDREFILEAMQEYADQQLRLYVVSSTLDLKKMDKKFDELIKEWDAEKIQEWIDSKD